MESEVTTVKAARSISRWVAALLLTVAQLAGCAGVQRSPETAPSLEAAVTVAPPSESAACSDVRAMLCDSGLRRPQETVADATRCGSEAAQLTDDLLLCLDRAGASCDEVATLALGALRGCGQRLLVNEAASGDAALQRARQFLEAWVESGRPWLAVGPLGFVVAPEMARRLAASSLRRGDAAGASSWLDATQGVDGEDLATQACRWAASASELTEPPRDLSDLPSVTSALLAWQGCAGR